MFEIVAAPSAWNEKLWGSGGPSQLMMATSLEQKINSCSYQPLRFEKFVNEE